MSRATCLLSRVLSQQPLTREDLHVYCPQSSLCNISANCRVKPSTTQAELCPPWHLTIVISMKFVKSLSCNFKSTHSGRHEAATVLWKTWRCIQTCARGMLREIQLVWIRAFNLLLVCSQTRRGLSPPHVHCTVVTIVAIAVDEIEQSSFTITLFIFFMRILFFRQRLNILIFLPIQGWKYSCDYSYVFEGIIIVWIVLK